MFPDLTYNYGKKCRTLPKRKLNKTDMIMSRKNMIGAVLLAILAPQLLPAQQGVSPTFCTKVTLR